MARQRPARGGYGAGRANVSDLPPPPLSVCVQPDPARLLAAVADALNACERHGLIPELEHGAVLTRHGYVLPLGDARLGSRWAVRMPASAETGAGQEITEGNRQ